MRKEKNASSSSKRLRETTKRDEKEERERERERVSSFLSRCYSPPFDDVLLSLLQSSRVRCVCFSAFEALFSIHFFQRLTKTSNNAKKTQTTSEKETTD
jgi:hypothetical protein